MKIDVTAKLPKAPREVLVSLEMSIEDVLRDFASAIDPEWDEDVTVSVEEDM